MYMMSLPTGTQVAQMPIGAPRLSAGNHIPTIAGATTATSPMPIPSITRLASNRPVLGESAPTTAPVTVQPAAMSPAAFGPKR